MARARAAIACWLLLALFGHASADPIVPISVTTAEELQKTLNNYELGGKALHITLQNHVDLRPLDLSKQIQSQELLDPVALNLTLRVSLPVVSCAAWCPNEQYLCT
jgi:hypothetical protein